MPSLHIWHVPCLGVAWCDELQRCDHSFTYHAWRSSHSVVHPVPCSPRPHCAAYCPTTLSLAPHSNRCAAVRDQQRACAVPAPSPAASRA